jgi:hypothetical protein
MSTFNLEVNIDVEVEYTLISKGRPATGPSYSCGGEPAEPPEFQIDRVMSNGVDIMLALSEDTLELLRDHANDDYSSHCDSDYEDSSDDDY